MKFKSVFKKADEAADEANEEIDKSRKLILEYHKALEELKLIQSCIIKIQDEVVLKGRTEHLSTAKTAVKSLYEEQGSKVKKLKKKVDKADSLVKKKRQGYDKRIDNVGKVWVLTTLCSMLLVFLVVQNTRFYMDVINPDLRLVIDTFGLRIDPKFYEIVAQMILALAIALFIGKRKESTSHTASMWWAYREFAMGVTAALTGLAICLYVIAGDKPGIYTFSMVATCFVVLLYSALKPLLKQAQPTPS